MYDAFLIKRKIPGYMQHLFEAINYDKDPEKPPDATGPCHLCKGQDRGQIKLSDHCLFPTRKNFIELKKDITNDNGSKITVNPKIVN
jgi:hypothetical protein